jgi:tetratricopeptide (TPR) repeat protein
MTKRLLILAAALTSATLVVLLGGVLREARPADSTAATAAGADEQRSVALRGLEALGRYRATGDPSHFSVAEASLRRALALAPGDGLALTGLATLAAGRHDFRESLRLARRAVRAAPDAVAGYGALGDALLELGRYDEAFRAYDRMVALKPNLAGYSRIAYARELLGRPEAAIEAMELALDAAGPQGEPTAWALVELGKLHFGVGRTDEAGRAFRAALVALPDYGTAYEWLARVEAARGRHARAIALQRRAVANVPLPHRVAQLGDLLAAAGRPEAAREQFALVAAIDRLQTANGVRTDLETALFRTDHGIRLRETLSLARKARADRPSILGDDALAWALARNGRCAEALGYSKRSLRLGTRDASFYFHRGMIERCLGHAAEARSWFARALTTNPHFSLRWSPTARRYAS